MEATSLSALPAFDAEKPQILGVKQKIIADNLPISPALCPPTEIYVSAFFFFLHPVYYTHTLEGGIELAVEFERPKYSQNAKNHVVLPMNMYQRSLEGLPF